MEVEQLEKKATYFHRSAVPTRHQTNKTSAVWISWRENVSSYITTAIDSKGMHI